MADPELIEETNRLLRTILENDAEQRAKAEQLKAETDKMLEGMRSKRDQELTERLRERGLPEEAAEGGEDAWEARLKASRQGSQERIEAARQRHDRYQEELLSELRTQSDLLRQIAERLAR